MPCASACSARRVCTASGRSRRSPRSITSSPNAPERASRSAARRRWRTSSRRITGSAARSTPPSAASGGKKVLSARLIQAAGSPRRCALAHQAERQGERRRGARRPTAPPGSRRARPGSRRPAPAASGCVAPSSGTRKRVRSCPAPRSPSPPPLFPPNSSRFIPAAAAQPVTPRASRIRRTSITFPRIATARRQARSARTRVLGMQLHPPPARPEGLDRGLVPDPRHDDVAVRGGRLPPHDHQIARQDARPGHALAAHPQREQVAGRRARASTGK